MANNTQETKNDNNYGEFGNYFDIDKMQRLQDAVAKSQDIASLIVDTNGNNLTKPTHFSVGLIRIIKKNKKVDEYFDQGLKKQYSEKIVKAAVVRNKTGDMMAGVIPIIINDKKVATWVVGGLFDREMMLPREAYATMAAGLDVDKDEFLEAIDSVSVMSRMDFLSIFEVVRLIAEQMAEIIEKNQAQKERLEHIEKLAKENEEANVALKVQAERYRLLSENSDEVVFDYNPETDVNVIPNPPIHRELNEVVIERFVADKRYKDFIHPDDVDIYIKNMKDFRDKNGDIQFEIRMNITSKNYHWVRYNVVPLLDNEGNVIRILGRVQDIEKEKEELMELEARIKKDPMTGLLNKNATRISADKFLNNREDGTHALMIVDIDDFKNVNDTFGHLFGDMVIENVAAAISSTFRKSDIIGRIGGDEFLVIMKNTGKRIAEIKARDLGKAVTKTYSSGGKTLKITCSVGIAFFPDDANNYEDLFGKADIAMYNAKLEGKNTVSVYDRDKEQVFAEITKEEGRGGRSSEDYDQDFIRLAFGLLFESQDIENSMKILTERITDKYSVQKLIYNYSEKGQPDMLQVWDKEHSTYVAMVEADFADYSEGEVMMRQQEYVVINDTEKETQNIEIAKYAKSRGMTALIGMHFPLGDRADEYVIFANTDAPRSWTESERKTFKHIAEVFALFGRMRRDSINTRKEITALASRDQITGVYNRIGFENKIVGIMNEYQGTKNYVLSYVDISNFSYINENFGIVAGNKILKDLANVLCSIKNTVVCRVYGDQFLVFYYYDEGFDVADTFSQQADIFERQQLMIYTSGKLCLNAGFYEMRYDDKNISAAIDNANLARKKAKVSKSRSFKFFDREMKKEKDHEQLIASSFERAIEKQEFEMFLQPKIDLVTGTAVGAEALVRWRLSDGSLRMPGEFISVLEKYNFIQQMDFAMLEMALKTLEQWERDGLDLIPISVNFSKVNSNSAGFVDRLMNMFKQYNVPKRYIEIEINENALDEDLDILLGNLTTLKKRGLSIALDDFGKGFSSLGTLLSAPIDVVKVDKLFIAGLDDTIVMQDYISNICSLISSVKKKIIFEGVETKEQADFLYSCGISIVQGFLYGKPMDTEQFAEKYLQF